MQLTLCAACAAIQFCDSRQRVWFSFRFYFFAGWKCTGLHSGLHQPYDAHRDKHLYRQSCSGRLFRYTVLLATDRCLGCDRNVVHGKSHVQGGNLLSGEFILLTQKSKSKINKADLRSIGSAHQAGEYIILQVWLIHSSTYSKWVGNKQFNLWIKYFSSGLWTLGAAQNNKLPISYTTFTIRYTFFDTFSRFACFNIFRYII